MAEEDPGKENICPHLPNRTAGLESEGVRFLKKCHSVKPFCCMLESVYLSARAGRTVQYSEDSEAGEGQRKRFRLSRDDTETGTGEKKKKKKKSWNDQESSSAHVLEVGHPRFSRVCGALFCLVTCLVAFVGHESEARSPV